MKNIKNSKFFEMASYLSIKEPFMFITILFLFICFAITTLVVISNRFYANFIENSDLGMKMGMILLTVFTITIIRLLIEKIKKGEKNV